MTTRNYSKRGSTEEEKKIFAERLTYYIEKSEKTQAQVAKELGFNTSTLNMWCKGNSMPTSGKIQKIADYFHIGKSALLDENPSEYSTWNGSEDAMLLVNFHKLTEENKQLVLNLINQLLN